MPLVIEENFTAVLLEQLRDNEIDAILVALPVDLHGLQAWPVYDEPFVVLLPPDHRWSGEAAIPSKKLAEEPLLLLGPGHCFREQVIEDCPQCVDPDSGGPRPHTGSSLETIRHMVASGLGISVVPKSSIGNRATDSEALVARPFLAPAPSRRVALIWRKTYPRLAAVRALRDAMQSVPVGTLPGLVDTCGTGGGKVTTFNISTVAAFVAAGAGASVAKHGNRSFTSRCGSADVLEALGVPIEAPLAVMERSLADAGIVFMFAPVMHPAMRHVGPVRRELAIPTVMNVVGPLENPASAGRQVVGVAEAARLPLIAGALASLGSLHALVVHGEPGMDEISPLGPTQVIEIRDGTVKEWSIEPARFGFGGGRAEELGGGPPAANAAAVMAVLEGSAPPTARAAVLLNAAAALLVSAAERSFDDALERATEALDRRAGIEALERLRRAHSSS